MFRAWNAEAVGLAPDRHEDVCCCHFADDLVIRAEDLDGVGILHVGTALDVLDIVVLQDVLVDVVQPLDFFALHRRRREHRQPSRARWYGQGKSENVRAECESCTLLVTR